jgi:PAS domain S-box-containing protein
MRHQDGHDLWINLIGYVADPTETDRATFWILEDRTDFKRAEEALNAAYAEQSLIFDHSVVGIAFVKHRRIQRCNRRYEQIYGFPAGSLTGQSTRISYLSDEAYQAASKHVYEVLGSGKAYSREFIHKQPNGHPIWIRITGNALDPTQPNEGSI